jgi:hypothetical protein
MKKALIVFGLLLFALAVLIFRPVPIVKEEKALVVTGILSKVKGSENQDVFLKLKDDPTRYYINRGMELGLKVADLEKRLIGQEVTLKYPQYWTPLDPNNNIRHVQTPVWFKAVLDPGEPEKSGSMSCTRIEGLKDCPT